MKKILVILLLSIILFSCKTNPSEIDNGFKYIKDYHTGLCYSVSNLGFFDNGIVKGTQYDNRTLTCVPCDSLKNINVTIIEK